MFFRCQIFLPYYEEFNSNLFILKTNTFSRYFIVLVESTWNFERKHEPDSLSILETIHFEKRAYLNA